MAHLLIHCKFHLHTTNFDHRDFFLSIHVEIDKLQSKKTSRGWFEKKSHFGPHIAHS